jgi:hypothetical protein
MSQSFGYLTRYLPFPVRQIPFGEVLTIPKKYIAVGLASASMRPEEVAGARVSQ